MSAPTRTRGAATQASASRSWQSNANPTTTTSPFQQASSQVSEHQRSLQAGRKVGQEVKAFDTIALTGATGTGSASAPHLHFEIRTIAAPSPGLGLAGRVDPGTILGCQYLACSP